MKEGAGGWDVGRREGDSEPPAVNPPPKPQHTLGRSQLRRGTERVGMTQPSVYKYGALEDEDLEMEASRTSLPGYLSSTSSLSK